MNTARAYDRATGYMLSVITGAGTVQDLEYHWSGAGNLIKRIDRAFAPTTLEEDFSYDSLYRLTDTTVTAPLNGGSPLTYSNDYSATGRIVNKRSSNAGNYLSYGYGINAGPHAVTSVTAGSTNRSYTYDANGSMLTGPGRTVTWSEYNKPIRSYSFPKAPRDWTAMRM